MDNGVAKPFWVGLGASAGGLEALREVVRNLEPTIGAIYVVLQHMSPQHKSLLTELIGRETSLNVVEITDGVVGVPDTIYICPPNHDVIVAGGRLRLEEPSQEPGGPKPSVDRFLRSLAETVGDRAVGIILSGTGSDGATGIRAVRAAGGITIAQTEASAKYNGMPLSAMDTGCVDLQLSAAEIGARFEEIVRLPRDLERIAAAEPMDALANLFQIVQERTGIDFREYKPSTVRRRIERRITALGFNSLDTYLTHVREAPEEPKLLCRDMMISVTSFFRDMSEFEKLKIHLTPLVEELGPGGMRLWVPGCASGEEAYTLLMLVAEALGGVGGLDTAKIQVFATDIDVDALATARRGVYPLSIRDHVPQAYLKRYFTETDDAYQVSQALRERIVFTPHNLCQDPPFSNIDVITCRNLLIYFSHALQSKVFARLHYALKPSGLLFLGKSESIGGSETLFKPAGNSGQVYRRRTRPEGAGLSLVRDLGIGPTPTQRVGSRLLDATDSDPFGNMFHSLVRSMGPNGLLVTADLHIQRVYGNVDRFLSLSEGQLRGATINMLRDDLRHELRSLISLALRNKTIRKGLERRSGEAGTHRIQMEVHPIGGQNDTDEMALVIFREWEEEPAAPALPSETGDAAERRILDLEHELEGTRESLQQTVEELETANEELQSLNEELQSANEELQSANEELETTNEELQSTNEELITVNEELQINSYEMASINQELDSVLSNIAAPVLVVDARLHIVQCSQSAREMFQIASGVAKPHLSQLHLPASFPPLTTIMADVIQQGTKCLREIETKGFRGSVIAAPYFNGKGELIGATAIIQDYSDSRSTMLENLFQSLPLMIWQQDSDGRIVEVNDAAAQFMGVGPAEARGMRMDEVTRRLPGAAASSHPGNGQDQPTDAVNGAGNGAVQQVLVANGQDGSDAVFLIAQDSEATAQAHAPSLPGQVDDVARQEWVLAAESGQITLSAAAARVLGQGDSARVLSRAGFLKLFHQDDAPSIGHGLDGALEDAVPFALQVRATGRQAAVIQVSGNAVRAEAGDVIRVDGCVNVMPGG